MEIDSKNSDEDKIRKPIKKKVYLIFSESDSETSTCESTVNANQQIQSRSALKLDQRKSLRLVQKKNNVEKNCVCKSFSDECKDNIQLSKITVDENNSSSTIEIVNSNIPDDDCLQSSGKEEPIKKQKKRNSKKVKRLSSSDSDNVPSTSNVYLEYSPVRKSKRIKERNTRYTKKPNRKERLDSISDVKDLSFNDEIALWSRTNKRQLTNNLIYEQNRYNNDTFYNLDDIAVSMDEESFIVNDDEDDTHKPLRRKKRKKRLKLEKQASDINNDDVIEKTHHKRYKFKRRIVCSDEDEELPTTEPNKLNEFQSENRTSTSYENSVRASSRSRSKKYTRVLQKFQQNRAVRKLPLNERKKVIKENGENSDESSDNNVEDVFAIRSSDEEFIDDEGYGESHKSDNEHSPRNNQWIACLHNVIKGFHNPKGTAINNLEVNSIASTRNKRIINDSEDSDENEVENKLTKDEQCFYTNILANNAEAIKNTRSLHSLVKVILNESNHTALHIASMKGSLHIVQLLCSQGANSTALDKMSFVPLAYTALHKFPDCFEYLLNQTDLTILPRLCRKWGGFNLLHLLVVTGKDIEVNDDIEKRILECICVLKKFNNKIFQRYLTSPDNRNDTPFLLAVKNDLAKVVKVFSEILFENGVGDDKLVHFVGEENETFLHFAAQYSAKCLKEILPYFQDSVNIADIQGFTPLMYAAELGKDDCLEILLNFGADVNVKENGGASPLHLAAASGNVRSVELLLKNKHQLGCVDKFGWPPLLYANFKAKQDCVIQLFNSDPRQIFCLSSLLHNEDHSQRQKNAKVIYDTLLSISHIDAYYTLFNDFIGSNMSVLDENDMGVFTRTWRMILSFKNKVKWMRRRCSGYLQWRCTNICIDRSHVLDSAISQLGPRFSISSLGVRFKNEEGLCLGPKREFFDCIVKEITDPVKNLLVGNLKKQFSPTPNSYFLPHLKEYIEMQEQRKLEQKPTKLCKKSKKEVSAVALNNEEMEASVENVNDSCPTHCTTLNQSIQSSQQPSNHIATSNYLSNQSTRLPNLVSSLKEIEVINVETYESGISDEHLYLAVINLPEDVSVSTGVNIVKLRDENTHSLVQDVLDNIVESVVTSECAFAEDKKTNETKYAYGMGPSPFQDLCGEVITTVPDNHFHSNHGAVINNEPNRVKVTNKNISKVADDLVKHDNEKNRLPKCKPFNDYLAKNRSYLEKIRFIGQLVGQVIVSDDINISLQLTKPFIKQLLNIPLQHPGELKEIEPGMYSSVAENEIGDLEVPFSFSVQNPWNKQLEEVFLTQNKNEIITDKNKMDYLRLVSKFKFETLEEKELQEFKKGFYSSIQLDVISLFNADEFSLLLNGVNEVDVDDWKNNTIYSGWSKDSPVILWFWTTVDSLKSEEISLLLKFATGSPCVPFGGFSKLQGLSGSQQNFQIAKAFGNDRLPEAHTCFNQICLPTYMSQKDLSEKLLIAIRHGCEGFTMG